jgi:lipocalin-like protein
MDTGLAVQTDKGESKDYFGPHPLGQVMFGTDGRFANILLRSDLPRFKSNNRLAGTPDETTAVVAGSIGYFGTYTLTGDTLKLHIEGSTYPNWTKEDQTRTVHLTGDQIKWENAAASAGAASCKYINGSSGGDPVCQAWPCSPRRPDWAVRAESIRDGHFSVETGHMSWNTRWTHKCRMQCGLSFWLDSAIASSSWTICDDEPMPWSCLWKGYKLGANYNGSENTQIVDRHANLNRYGPRNVGENPRRQTHPG